MARSDCDTLRRLARQRLLVDPGGEPTRCDATCQRKAVPYPDWDTVPHLMPRCSGLVHSAEQRCVEGSPGMLNSSSIIRKEKEKSTNSPLCYAICSQIREALITIKHKTNRLPLFRIRNNHKRVSEAPKFPRIHSQKTRHFSSHPPL